MSVLAVEKALECATDVPHTCGPALFSSLGAWYAVQDSVRQRMSSNATSSHHHAGLHFYRID